MANKKTKKKKTTNTVEIVKKTVNSNKKKKSTPAKTTTTKKQKQVKVEAKVKETTNAKVATKKVEVKKDPVVKNTTKKVKKVPVAKNTTKKVEKDPVAKNTTKKVEKDPVAKNTTKKVEKIKPIETKATPKKKRTKKNTLNITKPEEIKKEEKIEVKNSSKKIKVDKSTIEEKLKKTEKTVKTVKRNKTEIEDSIKKVEKKQLNTLDNDQIIKKRTKKKNKVKKNKNIFSIIVLIICKVASTIAKIIKKPFSKLYNRKRNAKFQVKEKKEKYHYITDDELVLLRYRDQKGIIRKFLAFFINRAKVVKYDMTRFHKKLKYGTLRDKILILIMLILIIGFSSVVVFCLFIVSTAPEVTNEKLYKANSTIVLDKNDVEIVRLGAENREKVTYDDLPDVLIDAILATEDSRFFQHNGVDIARFTKAVIGQLMGHSDAGGGSTLTMQISKQVATSNEAHGIAGIIRKFTDIYLSVFELEKRYTKEQILEYYVNIPFLGSNSYGVEQACQTYFGKSVSEISLPEAAMIAGMFQAPSSYNPYSNPEKATKRRNTVLNLMVRHGYITEEVAEAAKEVPIENTLIGKNYGISKYQGFIDTATQEVEDRFGVNPYNVSMIIKTTLDTEKQDVINDLYNTYKWKNEVVQAGLAIVSVKDGSVVAVGAGRNKTGERSFNFATSARRQPGSVAKPVIDYGPAIEYLGWGTGQTIVDDEYGYTVGGNIRNWDRKFKGIMTIKTALSDSRNIPALFTFHHTTGEQKKSFAQGLGWYHVPEDGKGSYYETCAIGGFEGITPLEAAATYATFGRGGMYIEPYSVKEVILNDTDEVLEVKPEKHRAMTEETAYMINMILKYAVTSGDVRTGSVSGTDVAAKTGTTTIDNKIRDQISKKANIIGDSWLITYSPDYAISLWYGYENINKKHYLTSKEGSRARREISRYVSERVLPKNRRFTKPSTVITKTIELETDPVQLATEFTPSNLKATEYFKKGTEPTEYSDRFSRLDNPVNVTYTSTGSSVTINWVQIPTPAAVDLGKLQTFFNESVIYKNWADKYYKQRISYNEKNIGAFGYRIYMNGTEVGFTTGSSFTYNGAITQDTKFTVKSSYQIFKANQSTGITVTVSPNSTNIKPDIPVTTNPVIPENVIKNVTIDFRINGCVDLAAFKALGADPGDKVVVRADGKDVTNSAIIGYTCYDAEDNKLDSCSSMEEGKEYKVRFNATYNGIKATNKQINIKPTC